MRQGSLVLAAGRVRSTRKKRSKIPNPAALKPRNQQQPDDCDHHETACDETRSMRQPITVSFHGSRVRGNRPRAAFAISENHETYAYRHTDKRTDKLNNATLYAPRYKGAFWHYSHKSPSLRSDNGSGNIDGAHY